MEKFEALTVGEAEGALRAMDEALSNAVMQAARDAAVAMEAFGEAARALEEPWRAAQALQALIDEQEARVRTFLSLAYVPEISIVIPLSHDEETR